MCFKCKICGNPVGPEDRQVSGSNDYCRPCYALLREKPAGKKKPSAAP